MVERIKQKKIIDNPKTYLKRELLGHYGKSLSFKKKLKKSKAINLKNNHNIITINSNYFDIHPINKDKIFK